MILEETIAQLTCDGNTADVVYLDFAKAVKWVNHRLLLVKLESFGLLIFWSKSGVDDDTRKECPPTVI